MRQAHPPAGQTIATSDRPARCIPTIDGLRLHPERIKAKGRDLVVSTPFPNRRPCFLPSLLFLSAALDLQFPRHTFLCRDGLTTRPLNATALNFHKGLHIMVACYAERMTVDMIVWTWARSLFTRPDFPLCRCIYPPHWRTSTSGHRGAGVRVHVCYGTMQSLDKPSSQACGAP